MERIDEPIDVKVKDGRPVAFEWRDSVYEVFDVLDTWTRREGAWWRFSGSEQRHYYRVHAGWPRHRVTAEFYRSERKKEERWVLAALYR